jgi:hypothetical protein
MAKPPPLGNREGIMIRELGSEVVALDTLECQVHQLNATASLIWKFKNSGLSEPEIAECLTTAFEVDLEAAVRDVVTTVTQLRAIGLLPEPSAEC